MIKFVSNEVVQLPHFRTNSAFAVQSLISEGEAGTLPSQYNDASWARAITDFQTIAAELSKLPTVVGEELKSIRDMMMDPIIRGLRHMGVEAPFRAKFLIPCAVTSDMHSVNEFVAILFKHPNVTVYLWRGLSKSSGLMFFLGHRPVFYLAFTRPKWRLDYAASQASRFYFSDVFWDQFEAMPHVLFHRAPDSEAIHSARGWPLILGSEEHPVSEPVITPPPGMHGPVEYGPRFMLRADGPQCTFLLAETSWTNLLVVTRHSFHSMGSFERLTTANDLAFDVVKSLLVPSYVLDDSPDSMIAKPAWHIVIKYK